MRIFSRLLLALATITLAGQPVAASAQDTIARAQAAQAQRLATQANAGLARSGAAFQLMQKLRAGQSATLLINSDSTGVDANATPGPYWPRKLALWLGKRFPAVTVLYYSAPTSSGWGSPVVLQQGTGAALLRFFNGAVSGTQPFWFYGSTFNTLYGLTALGGSAPDLLIFNHGKNNDGTQPLIVHAAMYQAAVAQLANAFPNAGVIITKENPDPVNYNYAIAGQWTPGRTIATGETWQSGARAYQATTGGVTGTTAPVGSGSSIADGSVTWAYRGLAQLMDAKVQGWALAADLNGWDVADFYGRWMADGNPDSYFANTVHPNQTGDDIDAAIMQALFENVTGSLPRRTPSLLDRVPNLLANGNFQAQSGGATAVPDGWTSTNATFSRYTTSFENGCAYALQMANTASGPGFITQTISGAALARLRGQYMTCAARVRVPANTDPSAGAIQIGTAPGAQNFRTWGMSAVGSWTNGYIWLATSGYIAPTDTSVTITLWGAYGAGSAAGTSAIFDRVSCVPGLQPKDMQ